MSTQNHSKQRISGFSLIEAMIAVLVLAVGLLALVALQSNLVREGADAKARSRIASLITSRMDEARAVGYAAMASEAAAVCAGNNDICQAQADAAVSGLSVTETVGLTAGANGSEFKTLTVSAAWTDSAANARTLEMRTAISPLSLDTSSTLLNQQLAGDVSKKPIVRTADPATDGVVPIALGDGSASAASNPTPELVGKSNNQQVVGTRFTVLTYVPSGSSSIIQKRVENTVIKCACQFGAGGTNLPEIYRESQWPAIWTGERYDVYEPATSTPAPGQSVSSGPQPGVQQSPLCQECCRDHHDDATTGVAKFDPERSDGKVDKYELVVNNGVKEFRASTANYFNACRVIRVDGMWRTAADMYSRQLGLLETQPENSVLAKTGLPTSAATAAYTIFVKSYMAQYDGSTGAAPTNAFSLFDATSGLNEPALVPIAAPSTTDFRYLHARGLYVDYLEAKARKKLQKQVADCPAGTAPEDCVMPYLPFTSANLTEIATWTASDEGVLVVNSGNVLATNPSQPSGGRTIGTSAGTADNTVAARISNSGVAVTASLSTLAGVDPTDGSQITSDVQPFEVGGTPGQSTGDSFLVSVNGGGANPFVFYVFGADTGECKRQSNGSRPCSTNSILPLSGRVRAEHYWLEDTVSQVPTSSDGMCDAGGVRVPIKGKDDVPRFTDYSVTATVGGTAPTSSSVATPGKAAETTTFTFGSIAAGSTVALTMTAQTPQQFATATTCTVGNGGNTIINGWYRPWLQ
ncbi:MAG: prepilin-type N-terminal cleavage/methylation domain-containing protein [Pseudomonadota bacterium]|nr:prepilin-type N-terminal cleavage/methylation domain-containing protein [Pseudomonadota bacterium]